SAAGSGPIALAVGDFNGDGAPDLAVANNYSDNVSILLNDGAWSGSGTPGAHPGPRTTPASPDLVAAEGVRLNPSTLSVAPPGEPVSPVKDGRRLPGADAGQHGAR